MQDNVKAKIIVEDKKMGLNEWSLCSDKTSVPNMISEYPP